MTRSTSKVTRELAQADRDELNALIARGQLTLDEMLGWLRDRGYTISRSSLHRYAQTFEDRLQQIAEAGEKTRAILSRFEGRPATEMAEGASLVAQDLIMRRLLSVEEIDDDTSVVDLAHALAKLETSAVGRERLKVQWDKGVTAGATAVRANLRRELEREPELLSRMLALVEQAETEARAT